jgi:uncharacterized protein (DUF983 family)
MLGEPHRRPAYDRDVTRLPSRPVRTNPLVAFGRSLLKRCPRCGQGRLFRRWFEVPPRCPRCRLSFDRGDGFWLGSMAINLGVTELVFGIFALAVMVATWPNVPWALLTVLAVVLNAVVPVVFYPWAKTIFLGIDLVLHQIDDAGAAELELTEEESEARQAAEANVASAIEDAVTGAFSDRSPPPR